MAGSGERGLTRAGDDGDSDDSGLHSEGAEEAGAEKEGRGQREQDVSTIGRKSISASRNGDIAQQCQEYYDVVEKGDSLFAREAGDIDSDAGRFLQVSLSDLCHCVCMSQLVHPCPLLAPHLFHVSRRRWRAWTSTSGRTAGHSVPLTGSGLCSTCLAASSRCIEIGKSGGRCWATLRNASELEQPHTGSSLHRIFRWAACM